MKKTKRKGFTLVELLVVIAILAVLATVSVVGYLGFTKKAKISNDISLTTQMNTILQAEEAGGETFDTPHDAVEALQNGGLDISKLTPTTNNYSYVYDLKQNRMFLLDDKYEKVAPSNQEITVDKTQLYAFVGSQSEVESGYWKKNKYSFYLKDNFSFDTTNSSGKSVLAKFDFGTVNVLNTTSDENSSSNTNPNLTVETGLDAGTNKNVNVTFSGKVDSDIVIRTVGDQSQVSISVSDKNTTTASVSVHGFAQNVTVSSSNATVAVVGSCKELNVESGTVNIEETAMVSKATVTDGATVKSEGYVGSAFKKSGNTTTEDNEIIDGKVGGNYEISNLSKLEAFRDTVNAGNDFSEFNSNTKSVVLTSDITLKNGWTPIGEGYRKYNDGVSSTNATFFKGTFDGNNHTISNLNNSNYTPTDNRLSKGTNDSESSYCYGLFALVEDATIKNLKLSNVNIDGQRYTGANMDSVAALVGYAQGNCNFYDITVSGSIKAYDAVAGIVGRWYDGSKANDIKDCVNNASITAIGASNRGKAAGIVGYVDKPANSFSGAFVNLKNCTNTGNVTGIDYVGGLATFANENYVSKDRNCSAGSVTGKGDNKHY